MIPTLIVALVVGFFVLHIIAIRVVINTMRAVMVRRFMAIEHRLLVLEDAQRVQRNQADRRRVEIEGALRRVALVESQIQAATQLTPRTQNPGHAARMERLDNLAARLDLPKEKPPVVSPRTSFERIIDNQDD